MLHDIHQLKLMDQIDGSAQREWKQPVRLFDFEWLLKSSQKQKEKLTAQNGGKNELPKQLENI